MSATRRQLRSPYSSHRASGPAVTFGELEIVDSDFDLWAAIIRSDQMPQQDVYHLLQANPNFASWYRKTYIAAGDAH